MHTDPASADGDPCRFVAALSLCLACTLIGCAAPLPESQVQPDRTVAGDLQIPPGFTPLHWAAWTRDLSEINALLEAGADVNVQSENLGTTPLHHAAMQGDVPSINALLEAGAAGGERTIRSPRQHSPAPRC